MMLLRRLDDAICALRTGHSRRDLDRVRDRRLRLLALRLVRRRESRVAEVEKLCLAHGDYFAWRLAFERDDLRRLSDLAQRFLESRERAVRAVLLHEIYVDSLFAHAAHVHRNAQVGLVDGIENEVSDLGRSFPRHQRLGKLYKGLLHYSALHALQYKLGVCVRHVQSILALIDFEFRQPYSLVIASEATAGDRGWRRPVQPGGTGPPE